MGMAPSAVSRIISGKRQIKAREVPAILAYFGAAPEASDIESLPVRLENKVEPGVDHSEAWLRLIDKMAKLTDAELDFLSISAEGLLARRNQVAEKE